MLPEMTEFEPVRCWGEYDGWHVMLDRQEDAWFKLFCLPTGGEDRPFTSDATSVTRVMEMTLFDHLPLRSLRVLLRSGHEVHLWGCWSWALREEADASPVKWGSFRAADCSDVEAVTRALSEAQQWLQRESEAARTEGGQG